MRAGAAMVIGALVAASACGGGKGKSPDGGPGGAGGSIGIGGAGGAADADLVGCLDQPGAIDRPPNGRLPCELIPPGVRL